MLEVYFENFCYVKKQSKKQLVPKSFILWYIIRCDSRIERISKTGFISLLSEYLCEGETETAMIAFISIGAHVFSWRSNQILFILIGLVRYRVIVLEPSVSNLLIFRKAVVYQGRILLFQCSCWEHNMQYHLQQQGWTEWTSEVHV